MAAKTQGNVRFLVSLRDVFAYGAGIALRGIKSYVARGEVRSHFFSDAFSDVEKECDHVLARQTTELSSIIGRKIGRETLPCLLALP